jgi:rubrerythrin
VSSQPQAQGIDFATVSLRDALDLAVLIEEEARDRYEELAAQLLLHRTPAAAAFFTKMMRVEEIHRKQLTEQRAKAFGTQPSTVRREQLFDIEAPDYDEARMNMSHRAALNVALRSEVKAHRFFVEALQSVSSVEVKKLFEELCEEEVEHQALVKAELAKLPPPTPDEDDDFSDDPVAL